MLIQSKRLERKKHEVNNYNLKSGYLLVINRMNELLQDKFPTEEATLRYLESEEFKDFVRTFNTAMENINRTLKNIADNTSDLSSIVQSQSSMMDAYFQETTVQSKEMIEQYKKQYYLWENYLK